MLTLALLTTLAAVWLGLAAWYAHTTPRDVTCTLDLEATPEHFHAHVRLRDDVRIQPGDEVLVHGAPSRIALGTRMTVEATATVRPASWLKQRVTKLLGGTEITELYDVGFEG